LRQAGVNAIKPVPLCRGIKLHNQADRWPIPRRSL
jgi:hypothetical protein